MDNGRDRFEALYAGQRNFFRIVQVILNVVLAAIQTMHLNVRIFCIIYLFCRGKRTLPDDSIVPCQWINVFRADVVDTDTSRINDLRSVRVDRHPLNDRNIRDSAKRSFALLRFVRFYFPIVFQENSIYEILFLFPFERDVYALVHQEVCPILANLFRHAYRISVAFQFFNAIPYRVTVEVLDIPFVPVSPHADQIVEISANCIVAKLL